MYTRNHEFFFTQRPFECKFTLEGIRTLTNDKGAFKLGNAKKDAKQIPINVGDGKKGLYPYGYGLTY